MRSSGLQPKMLVGHQQEPGPSTPALTSLQRSDCHTGLRCSYNSQYNLEPECYSEHFANTASYALIIKKPLVGVAEHKLQCPRSRVLYVSVISHYDLRVVCDFVRKPQKPSTLTRLLFLVQNAARYRIPAESGFFP
jgi:hypothetical protein